MPAGFFCVLYWWLSACCQKLYKIEYFMLLIYSEALFIGRCSIRKKESFLHVAAVFSPFTDFMQETGF